VSSCRSRHHYVTFLRAAVGIGLATALCVSCASSATPGTVSTSPATGRVSGRVIEAPMCPVQRAGSRCPPRPVRAAPVVALARGRVIATTRTDRNGRFKLALAPGRYIMRATLPSALRSTTTKFVQVGAHPATVTLTLDSGIR
jgi:hypothetical protein